MKLYRFLVPISLLLLILLVPTRVPLAAETASIVAYDITVTLSEDCTYLEGQERVIWTNPGSIPVQEMYFHLYPNAFRPNSSFLLETKGVRRGERLSAAGYGYMELRQVRAQGRNLNWQFVQPDDGNQEDGTLMRVSLPQPVAPGDSIRLDIEFVVKLPMVFARMGKYVSFVMAGQWFPKVAAYETAGTRGRQLDGWNVHQYHANTEFYANFGTYRVTINVPKTHMVAASGQLLEGPRIQGNKRQYVFQAEKVHDFAWAADNNFCEHQATFSSEIQPEVAINLYLQPQHEYLLNHYLQVAKTTLDCLSRWLVPYPYPSLTIVCPRAGAIGAGGMEYPTLITGWDASVHDRDLIGRVLIHEIIHQYFYGLVATNEVEEAWLDEGFTSYLEDKIIAHAFNGQLATAKEATSILMPEPLVKEGWKYSDNYSYQANAYVRGKLILHEIERLIGWERMQTALQVYCQRFLYDHPSTADWQQVLEEVTGQSWQAFFANYIYGAGMQDYAIDEVATAGERTSVWLSGPREERELVLRVALADGTSVDLVWNPIVQSQLTFEHSAPPVSLELDPAPHRVLLDHNRSNNRYYVKASNWLDLWLTQLLQFCLRLLGW
ncbi:MAG: M1 family metallopeptidase [Firmicutes bacterium]|nr:M1 family metallopeptidase [Bacillota bacterium]